MLIREELNELMNNFERVSEANQDDIYFHVQRVLPNNLVLSIWNPAEVIMFGPDIVLVEKKENYKRTWFWKAHMKIFQSVTPWKLYSELWAFRNKLTSF